MEVLYTRYRRLMDIVPLHVKRSLVHSINWKARAICIEGARGTGKSTMMLQYIKENLPLDQTLYVTLDDLYFRDNSLVELAEQFYADGGRYLFIDEVHKYDDWQSAVKNLYDFYPQLKLVVSGSSILALQRSRVDLSRRLLHYHLPELSLREYLHLRHGIEIPAITIDDAMRKHAQIAPDIIRSIHSPLKYLKEYWAYGAYPFILEGEADYLMRINQLINVIIDYDLPEAQAIEVSTQAQLKRLLYIISKSVPFKPNVTKLAEQTRTTRPRLLEMLHLLEQAQLIRNLRSDAKGISLMNKPDKIFLNNTSLISALAEQQPDKGNLRETFFLSQVQNSGAIVTYPSEGDFMVNNKYLFEVGGKSKDTTQIKGHSQAFIAADEMETGWKNKVPLWMFGFLY